MQSLINCTSCTICDFLKLVEALFYFLVALSFVVAMFFIVLAGFLRIVTIGDKTLRAVSKKGLRFALIGFVVCLAAWLSAQVIYNVLGVKGGNWWNLNCEVSSVDEEQEKDVKVNKYSEFPQIEPLENLNQLINGSKKAGLIDLKKIDQNNFIQDLSLMYPGESVKFLAGYSDLNQEDLEKIANLLNGFSEESREPASLKRDVQELARADMLDGGLLLTGTNDFSGVNVPDFDPGDYDFNSYLNKLIKLLLKQNINKLIVYKSGNSEIMLDNCTETGGDWIEFYNECTSRKQVCGKEEIRCSGVVNKISGCQCPEGSCLVNGGCTKRSIANNPNKDDDGDGAKNSEDQCANTPKKESINRDQENGNYGCSCSQLILNKRNCPTTRCEGTSLVIYPPSGADVCNNGKITRYSCDPVSISYNATCNSVKSIGGWQNKEQVIKENDDLYNLLKEWLNKGKSNQNSGDSSAGGSSGGSGSGSSSGGGGGSSGGSGSGSGGKSPTGGGDRTGDSSGAAPGGKTVSAEDFKPSGDFNAWARCAGLKEGEIPQNGIMLGRCRDGNCNTMEIRYLSPEGKVIGNNGDTGGSPLIGYPNPGKGGFAKAAQKGEAAIYATQAQNHVSDGSGRPSPLTMRGDKRIGESGKVDSMNRYNIHGGKNTAGCLGLGGKDNFYNFMNQGNGGPWDMARSYGGGKTDGITQSDGERYKPYRTNDTVLFEVLPYGSLNEICGKINPYQAVETLKKQKGYDEYDPKWIKKS